MSGIAAIRKLRNLVWRRRLHRFLLLDVTHVVPPAADRAVTVEVYSKDRPAPATLLNQVKQRPIDWELRWQRDHRCALVRVEGEPAGYMWWDPGAWRWRDDDPPGVLPADVDFVYDVLIVPGYRGRNLYGHMLVAWAADARARGRAGAWALVSDDNTRMRAASAKNNWFFSPYAITETRIARTFVHWRRVAPPTDKFRLLMGPGYLPREWQERSPRERVRAGRWQSPRVAAPAGLG